MASEMDTKRIINFWKAILKEYHPLTDISTAVFIEQTVKKLEKLENLEK